MITLLLWVLAYVCFGIAMLALSPHAMVGVEGSKWGLKPSRREFAHAIGALTVYFGGTNFVPEALRAVAGVSRAEYYRAVVPIVPYLLLGVLLAMLVARRYITATPERHARWTMQLKGWGLLLTDMYGIAVLYTLAALLIFGR